MGDFFHRWKRKAGCVTLVMASVVMVAWMRSRSTVDVAMFSLGTCRSVFVSGGQSFQFIFYPLRAFFIDPFDAPGVESMFQVDQGSFEQGSYGHNSARGHLEYVTFDDEDEEQITMIPYQSIVVPLTALSAWLLISKPRPRQTPVKTIPEKAA